MSQIKHRQRLRDREEPTPAKSFTSVGPVPTYPGTRPQPVVTPTPAIAPIPEPAVVEPQVVMPPEVAEPQATQPETPEVLIHSEPQVGDSTITQKSPVRATAESLASMPTDEYNETLAALQVSDPFHYADVVEELNKMVAEDVADEKGGEGDGYDLSTITPAAG